MATQKTAKSHRTRAGGHRPRERQIARHSSEQSHRATRGERLRRVRENFRLYREPWPVLGATLAGGAGVALASATGVAELAVGSALAYAAFRMLRDGVGPKRAFREGLALEQLEEGRGGRR